MLWPIIFPFEITFCLMVILIPATVFLAPRFHLSRKKTLAFLLFISFLMFVPACTSIMFAINPLRFGSFEYKDYNAVPNTLLDPHLVHLLPKSAEGIYASVGAGGFRAHYRISREGMDAWMTDQWERCGNTAVRPYSPPSEFNRDGYYWLPGAFDDITSTMTKGMIVFRGPQKGNGGRSIVFFNETIGMAWQDTAYW